MSKKVWTTKDGTKVRISDMSDTHLCNTIRMLERGAEARRNIALLEAYSIEACVSGDMASLCISQDIKALQEGDLDQFLPPIYEHLLGEAYKRGLKLQD